MAYDDIYRVLLSRALAVGTAGGAVTSLSALSAQTYAVDLIFPGVNTVSTSGCRFAIGVPTDTVSSTQGALLPPNWPQRYKVTPGQTVFAISNDATAINLTVIELTK